MSEAAVAGMGHNLPPEELDEFAEKLRTSYSDELMIYNTRVREAAEQPTDILDDDTAAKVGDYIKKVTGCMKMLDAARKTEKEPHLEKGRKVDNFFKKPIETLEDIKKKVEVPLGQFLKAKEDRKRREAEELARKKAIEAAEALRIAQEKEADERRKREEAEADKKRIADAAAAAAAAAAADAERVRKEAEAEQAAIRKKAADDLAAKQKELDDLKAQQIADETANKAALKKAEDDKKAAEKSQREAEKQAEDLRKSSEKAARDIESEGRSAEREAQAEIKAIDKDVRVAERETEAALDTAVRQDKQAIRAEKQTMVKGSELSRTRGDSSLASVTEKWVGEVANRDDLDLETLRDHIPMDALHQAVQHWVDANKGNRTLRGAFISQETRTAVR